VTKEMMFRTLIQLVVHSLQKQTVLSPTFIEYSRQRVEGAGAVTAAAAAAAVTAVLKHIKTFLVIHSIERPT
jgi:hypothetical protein